MKVSVIVPIYNVEKYIKQCIDSICNQTLKDIEIIAINDGSLDKSIDILKSINDDRIKIINQENKGLSGARNTGLRMASGEYVAFVDSDDFLGEKFALEDMYNLAINDNSDIVAGNCIWYYSEKNNSTMPRKMSCFKTSPMDSEKFLLESLKSYRIYAPVWLNLYRRNLLINNDIFFKEKIYHEDEEFTPRTILKANKISIYDKDFYIYRQRNGSIMNSNLNIKGCTDLLDTFMSLETLLDDIEDIELKYYFKRYISMSSLGQIYKYKFCNLSKDVKKMILRNSVTSTLKIKAVLLNLNPKLFIKLDKIYRTIKNKEA